MGRQRYVVDAVVLEGRSVREVADATGLSKSRVHALVQQFRVGGYPALEPRSRRPASCPQAAGAEIQEAILALRAALEAEGHDAGPHTLHHHLSQARSDVPSVATIWRVLQRHGRIRPQPQKRPRSSFIRFEAALPNETWQSDTTHWQLADGSDVEILNFIDDHSRFLLACDVFPTVKGLDVVRTFHFAAQEHGYPASLLTDNGAVFTSRLRKGKGLLETELDRLGITYKNSRPYHPQTCGKVERFHQTLKRWLAKQAPARTIAELQVQLDAFRTYYNSRRPHRALNKQTPLHAMNARMKAGPSAQPTEDHFRIRHDKVDKCGRVTLRYLGRLRHIAIGAAHARRRVVILVANQNVRVVDEHGTLIRELTLDPTRNYQGLGTPPGRRPKLSTMS